MSRIGIEAKLYKYRYTLHKSNDNQTIEKLFPCQPVSGYSKQNKRKSMSKTIIWRSLIFCLRSNCVKYGTLKLEGKEITSILPVLKNIYIKNKKKFKFI